jgi:SAM-dependent methyltransferase
MSSTRLLGDSSARDYSAKLRLFNACAAPELRAAATTLELHRGMRVLDAGCGTGEVLDWLHRQTAPEGMAVGVDLAFAHASLARALGESLAGSVTDPRASVVQADLLKPPFAKDAFDLIWSVNTLNHLRDPVLGLKTLTPLLRPGGRVALGQSALLPEMFFAWDARLERRVMEALRTYYLDRYHLEERDLMAVRALVGWLRMAGLRNVEARTFTIERISPLGAPDEAYLLEAIFKSTWGERLRPYMEQDDYRELERLCDPSNPGFALRRPDFHFLQTFTLARGEL